MVEQCKQLQQVIQDVAFLLLYTQDVRRVERFGLVHLQLLIEGKESKLEEILDDNGDLRRCKPKEALTVKTADEDRMKD